MSVLHGINDKIVVSNEVQKAPDPTYLNSFKVYHYTT